MSVSDKLMIAWDDSYEILKRAGIDTRNPEDVVDAITDILRYVERSVYGGINAARCHTGMKPRVGYVNYGNPVGSKASHPKCECGGEKTKMPHIHWCPLYKGEV